jgi:hypothetical protein
MIPLAAVTGGALLFLSLYPHRIARLLTLAVVSAFVTAPLSIVLGFLLVVWLVRLGARQPGVARRLLRRAVLGALVLAACGALIVLRVPRRTTFRLLQSRFETAMEGAPETASEVREVRRRIGPWRVDAIATDSGGGVYFRIGTSGLLEPVSWGFVHAPRPSEPYDLTPFGFATLRPLHGAWFEFSARVD